MSAGATPLWAQTLDSIDVEKLRQKPVTTLTCTAADLLKQWWSDGAAAGNVGDYYDNRDGDHSPLNLGMFPQLMAVKYSADDIKQRKHWASQSVIHRAVVFGNSSTSAPPTHGGSNPRHYYCSPRGLTFLADEYAKNNLYIYPEHRDHDPGHNGRGDGFGDLYPTNTPYLLISQGSSGSDQPFMRAVPMMLAALRPEVKQKLTETGALMPTLQMILRRTNKQLKEPADYFTGKAHPSVFEGSWINELAMVKLANSLTLDSLPPIVRLRALEEDEAIAGVDYFEDNLTERLGDTSAVIARVHRSKERTRRLVVRADAQPPGAAPTAFRWTVLRGDPERIQIKPRDKHGAVAEITVAYHERRPIAPGSPLESNRVDIGVFAHNGDQVSAPAFITFYTLDSESRTYDTKGRIAEIAYNMGEVELRVTDWGRVLNVLAANSDIDKELGIDDKQRSSIAAIAKRHHELTVALHDAQQSLKTAEANEKTAEDKDRARKVTDAARKEAASAQRNVAVVLEQHQASLGSSVAGFVEERSRAVARSSSRDSLAALELGSAQTRFARQVEILRNLGVLRKNATLTAYDRAQLEYLSLTLIADRAFPGAVSVSYQPNFVDQRLTVRKPWRDVYYYDTKDQCTGWTRFFPDRAAAEFNHEGLLVVEKDTLGRCTKARMVRYTRQPAKGFPNPSPLAMQPVDEIVTYTFSGPEDSRGRRASPEPVK
jgi:hypothetical protein